MGMKYLLKVSNSIFDENFSDVLPDPFSFPFHGRPCPLTLSRVSAGVKCRMAAVRDKTEGRKGRGGRGKERDETKSCVPRVREKEIAIFFLAMDGKTYEGPGAPVPGFDALR